MKRILITGAASGIGLATAHRFHARGWYVGLLDIDVEGLKAVAVALGERTWCQALDVRDAHACQAAADEFASQQGGIDVLFNSAGVLRMGPLEEIPEADHALMLDINVRGLLNMCRAALAHLKQAPNGRVLNMSSASALYGVPDMAVYSASKFAVRGLTEALNLEWQRHGVTVQDLMPPFVDTRMVRGQQWQAPVVKRMGVKLSADDIAEAAEKALLVHRVHTPVGLSFRLTVLMEKLTPRSFTREVMRLLSR